MGGNEWIPGQSPWQACSLPEEAETSPLSLLSRGIIFGASLCPQPSSLLTLIVALLGLEGGGSGGALRAPGPWRGSTPHLCSPTVRCYRK